MILLLFKNNTLAKKSIALLLYLFLTACQQKYHTATRGFYYWKTTLALTPYEQQRLSEAGCKRIYLRCFDVDWNDATQEPKPVAVLRVQQMPQPAFHYVPVVFITQKAIARLNEYQAKNLAENIAKLLAQLSESNSLMPDEIQIDCDWTAGTKSIYFSLLDHLKKSSFLKNKKLGCTIRLHQVKYRMRSGIPPVDRGVIMCYNIGNLKQPGAHNSILDASLAKDYLKDLNTYPLPVDVALPLYSWCLHFRQGKLVGILRDVGPESVIDNRLFLHQKGNVYSCRKDSLWQGYSFTAGDELRIESPALKDLKEIADFTANTIRNDSLNIVFFHTDSLTLSKYSPHDLEALYHAYD